MDVYSPSHPTDQDMEVETPIDIHTPTQEETQSFVTILDNSPKSIHVENIVEAKTETPVVIQSLNDSTNYSPPICKTASPSVNIVSNNCSEKTILNATETRNENDSGKKSFDKSDILNNSKSSSSHRNLDKSSKHSSSTRRSKSPLKYRKKSRSPDKRKPTYQSSSHTHNRHSHSRRRSHSRERRRKRSRTPSRDRRSWRHSHTRNIDRKRSPSRERFDRQQTRENALRWESNRAVNVSSSEIKSLSPNLENVSIQPVETFPELGNVLIESSTPNISEELPLDIHPIQNITQISAPISNSEIMQSEPSNVFVNQKYKPCPSKQIDPDFIDWQKKNQPFVNRHPIQNFQNQMFMRNTFPYPVDSFSGNYQSPNVYPPTGEINSSFSHHGNMNPGYQNMPMNRFPIRPPSSQFLTNGNINPFIPRMNIPLGALLSQPPPPPIMPPHLSCIYTAPPPPPFIQPFPQRMSVPHQVPQVLETNDRPFPSSENDERLSSNVEKPNESPQHSRFSDVSVTSAPTNNLLETLMSKAGLPTNSLGELNIPQKKVSSVTLPETLEDKSPMKKINKLLNTAANTLLTHLTEAHKNIPTKALSPPPPPPPPLPLPGRLPQDYVLSPSNKPFVLPPLPTLPTNDLVESELTSNGDKSKEHQKHKSLSSYDLPTMLAKRHRSEFTNFREWQDRIALEVKGFIKPSYAAGKITKEDCRKILKKSVTEISRSKCSSINTKKIGEFIKLYLHKYHKYRKLKAKQKAIADSLT